MRSITKLFVLLLSLLMISCSSDDDDNNFNGSIIDVFINGTPYVFDTFTVIKHFEGTPNDDEFPDWFEVEARINNESDIIMEFDVELGHTGNWESGTIIGELNLTTNNNGNICNYYGVNIEYPSINVSVNNEEEFIATFSFTNNYGGDCGNNSIFGDEVIYTNGSIYINL